MSVCPADGIAMYPRRDGLGAHFGAMMRVYAHARESQRTFCPKRWYSMEHAEGDAEAYAADMFRFVGGEFFGPEALPSTPTKVEVGAQGGHAAMPALAIRRELRDFYLQARRAWPMATPLFNSSRLSVALHVRRGDVAGRFVTGMLRRHCWWHCCPDDASPQ